MGARAFQLLGDDIRPVNRHDRQCRRETNINLPPYLEETLIENNKVKVKIFRLR
jgi:hypothetical protein